MNPGPIGYEPTALTTELKAHKSLCGRGGETRTHDILLPKQARYQTALHPAAFYISLCILQYFDLVVNKFFDNFSKKLQIFFYRQRQKTDATSIHLHRLHCTVFKNFRSALYVRRFGCRAFLLRKWNVLNTAFCLIRQFCQRLCKSLHFDLCAILYH